MKNILVILDDDANKNEWDNSRNECRLTYSYWSEISTQESSDFSYVVCHVDRLSYFLSDSWSQSVDNFLVYTSLNEFSKFETIIDRNTLLANCFSLAYSSKLTRDLLDAYLTKISSLETNDLNLVDFSSQFNSKLKHLHFTLYSVYEKDLLLKNIDAAIKLDAENEDLAFKVVGCLNKVVDKIFLDTQKDLNNFNDQHGVRVDISFNSKNVEVVIRNFSPWITSDDLYYSIFSGSGANKKEDKREEILDVPVVFSDSRPVSILLSGSGRELKISFDSRQRSAPIATFFNLSTRLDSSTLTKNRSSERRFNKRHPGENFQHYFRRMVEESHNGLCVVDTDSNIVLWKNVAFRKMVLMRPQKYLKLEKIFSADRKEFVDSMASLVLETGNAFDGEVEVVKGNGRKLLCRVYISKLDSSHLLVELENVEDRRKLEALENQHEILKSQQVELIEEAKISGLGTMIGGISHEINNPLAVIRGRVDIALHKLSLNRLEEKDVVYTFERLKEMTERMTKIIKHLQTFAFGFSQESITDIDLNELVHESFFLLRHDLESKGIEVRTKNVSNEVFIRCGRSAMLQVFFNLLSNSIAAVEGLDEKWISVEVEYNTKKSFIYFVDSGKGIPPHISTRMLEPFFSTREVGEGNGLGLSVAKKSIAQYGGDLRYVSARTNTTFLVDIPSRIMKVGGKKNKSLKAVS